MENPTTGDKSNKKEYFTLAKPSEKDDFAKRWAQEVYEIMSYHMKSDGVDELEDLIDKLYDKHWEYKVNDV
jgi:hypothetical protein